MKPRKPEASRLEKDYLSRVRESLRGRGPAETEEIIQSLHEHIDEELASDSAAEVTLVQMANVLERLGPPEIYSEADPVASSEMPAAEKTGASADSSLSATNKVRYADLLDKIWIAYLISIVGLYVPVIDFAFCNIIGTMILAVVLLRLPTDQEELRSAGRFAVADVILVFLISVGALLTLAYLGFAALVLPIALAQAVCALIAYWKIMGKTAKVMTAADHFHIVRSIYSARRFYIIYFIALWVVAIVLEIVLAAALRVRDSAELWWLGFVLLPPTWILGWLFVLRPIGRARDALRGQLAAEDQ